jgi:putative membrane protein
MAVSGFFVARVPDATRPEYAGVSAFFVVLFALPSYLALWRWRGAARAAPLLLGLGAFALGIESLALVTGWPYGEFDYGDKIGAKVLGLAPWTVPFAWSPLVLGAWALTNRPPFPVRTTLRDRLAAVATGTLALLSLDLVLDPGAVHQGFWSYRHPGLYYGVPLSNFFGWVVSGLVGMAMMEALARPSSGRSTPEALTQVTQVPAELMTSVFWILCFWTSVCLWAGLAVPGVVGVLLLAVLWRSSGSVTLRCQGSAEARSREET